MGVRRGSRVVRAVMVVALAATGLLLAPEGTGAQPAAGSKPAIFHNGTWYLRNSMTTGAANITFRYGTSGDIPIMGDWDGDGDDTVGIVRMIEGPPGQFTYTWHLNNANAGGPATITPFVFGDVRFVAVDQLGTIPVVGDWNGDGIDTVGLMIYDFEIDGPTRWHLRNSNSAGPPETTLTYSRGRDRPVVGDWDGDGDDTVGVVRRDTWLLRNSAGGGNAQVSFTFGSPSYLELPVTGDWDGNGTDTPGLLRNIPPSDDEGGFERWLFRNGNSGGAASGQITYGSDAFSMFLPIEIVGRPTWQ